MQMLGLLILIHAMLNKLKCHADLIFSQSDYLIKFFFFLYKFTFLMTNSAEPHQLASEEANWSGSTLFAKVGHIQVQHDQG